MKTHSLGILRIAFVTAALFLNYISTHADTVYVWSDDGMVQKFTANGVGVLFTTNNLSGWNGPVGLALDNVGNLYAGVPGESHIWKFLPNGARSLIGSVDSISGLTFDATGNLFATSPNYRDISKLDYGPVGYYCCASTNYSQSHLSYPVNLAFDSAGNLYAVNNTNANPLAYLWPPSPYDNTIEEFASDFTHLGAFATGLNCPWGIAFDNSGNLYVANSGTNDDYLNDTIVKFTTNGVRSTFATATSGLSGPRGLAFDSTGNLYVANSLNGTIEKFTPNGSGSVFASGLNSPTSIAIFPGLKLWSATAITLDNPKTTPNGAFQFGFNENPGLVFTVLGTTNVALSLTNWATLGSVTEISPGLYRFTDPQATNSSQRFYRIVAP